MLVRAITPADYLGFNAVAPHPLQSVAWGEFRKKTGVVVERVGVFSGSTLHQGIQVTFHPIPKTSYTVGYFPKGLKPDITQLQALRELGQKHKALFIKLEPCVYKPVETPATEFEQVKQFLLSNGCQEGRPLFTRYSFQIDLRQSEENLLVQMKSKTRYNVRLAERGGVVIAEDNSVEAFEGYLKLLKETTQRQEFYAHGEEYQRKMWKELHKVGVARLLTAWHEKTLLVAWVVFVFNKWLYYPYGASSNEKRELMASNLMMWEVMRYGKAQGCTMLDMWGALGPQPDPRDPWYGFHRFKEGYGGRLVEFVGSYDLVLEPRLYPLYRVADDLRWKGLRAQAWLRRVMGR